MKRTFFTAYFSPTGTLIPTTVRNKAGDSNDALSKLYWPNKGYRPEDCTCKKIMVAAVSDGYHWPTEFDWVQPSIPSQDKITLEDEIWL